MAVDDLGNLRVIVQVAGMHIDDVRREEASRVRVSRARASACTAEIFLVAPT
jgi:hypothetical protein